MGQVYSDISKLRQPSEVEQQTSVATELAEIRRELSELRESLDIAVCATLKPTSLPAVVEPNSTASLEGISKQIRDISKILDNEDTLGMQVDDVFHQLADLKSFVAYHVSTLSKSQNVYYWILIGIAMATLGVVTFVGGQLLLIF